MTTTDTNSARLNLDPGVIKEKTDAYSSLTDLYKAEVFYNETYVAVAAQQEQERVRDELQLSALTFEQNSPETFSTLAGWLFTGSIAAVRKKEVVQQKGENPLAYAGILSLCFVLVLLPFGMRKRRRKKNAAETEPVVG